MVVVVKGSAGVCSTSSGMAFTVVCSTLMATTTSEGQEEARARASRRDVPGDNMAKEGPAGGTNSADLEVADILMR